MFGLQITLRLWQLLLPFLLLGGTLAAPHHGPCGENEQIACMLCNEPSCTVPIYYEPNCAYADFCHLGCGCKSGHVRNDSTNRCVSIYECKAFQWIKHDFRLERMLAEPSPLV
ncbi:uncharacterized protein LOC111065763 [Drosophila obscura]|uniref:uncharacterized protein LOC111065763 n=1 Tax=Drosophila obscura TaxID=7282 RepID=UPI001BB1CD54|nr:uncharacterized protein LOC111065763 [Drosophila obscura]